MKYIIRGEGMSVTKAINDYIEEKINRLSKYFKNDDVDARVLVKSYGRGHVIEVTIPYDRFMIRGEVNNDDLYAAIDLVVDKIERQIRKSKTKLKKFKNKCDFNFEYDYEDNDEDVKDSKIVKRKTIDVKPMSEEEAILEMELIGHNFYLFKSINTGNNSLVYKRKDGNYGVIETN